SHFAATRRCRLSLFSEADGKAARFQTRRIRKQGPSNAKGTVGDPALIVVLGIVIISYLATADRLTPPDPYPTRMSLATRAALPYESLLGRGPFRTDSPTARENSRREATSSLPLT